MRFILLVMLVNAAAVLSAQAPTDPAVVGNLFEITGVVTDAVSGRAVVRAEISLQPADGSGQARTAGTNQAGSFVFSQVPLGAWNMTAHKVGYAEGVDSFRKIILVNGLQPRLYNFALQPQALVSGVVANRAGNPIVHAEVVVFRPEIVDGRRRLQPRENTRTDDQGVFRFSGLGEGPAYVAALAEAGTGDLKKKLAYAPTYYPNSTDATTAQMVMLMPGQEQQLNIQVMLNPAFAVHGKVLWRGPPPELHLLAGPDSVSPLAASASPRFDLKTATFECPGVPPGDYILEAVVKNDSNEFAGYRKVTVSDHDVEDVAITVSFQPQLSGTVRLDGDLQTGSPISYVGLSSRFVSRGVNTTNANRFRMDGTLPPVNYRLLTRLNQNWYVKAATQGGRDVLLGKVMVADAGTSTPVEIVANPNGASVTLTVAWPENDESQPSGALLTVLQANGAEMVVISQLKIPAPAAPATSRPAQLNNLPPGQFVVYAWPDPVQVEYANPDALRPFDAFAQTVELTEGQRVNLTLKVATNR